MVSVLVSIKELPVDADSASPHYSLHLNTDTVSALLTNFSESQMVYPVLSLGHPQCGRSAILDQILIKTHSINANEDETGPFEQAEKVEGVYVWPYPVPLGNKTLMLLKLSGIHFRDQDEKFESIRKLIYALLSITSVSFVCFEKLDFFYDLGKVLDVYSDVSHSKIVVSRFFLFGERADTFAKGQLGKEFAEFKEQSISKICEFFYRGRDGINDRCLQQVLERLNSDEIHGYFLRTHERAQIVVGARSMLVALTQMFDILIRFANFDLDYQNFVSRSPNFDSDRYQTEIGNLIRQESQIRAFDTAKVYNLFVKVREFYSLDPNVLGVIRSAYECSKPIVVMVILGHQGKGKSTLLNHIVQHCLNSRRLKLFFKTGSTANHTTKESQVLSKPFFLPGTNQPLMLIDLEGLDSIQAADPRDMMLQRNLVRSILTIASVPYIIISNEIDSLKFAEKMIEMISEITEQFAFRIERIHFLLHDKDLSGAESENELITEKIEYLNRRYFRNSEIIKLTNKPNFMDASKSVMCKEFLNVLLRDSNYPKRFLTGAPVDISDMVTQIRMILQLESENLALVHFESEEREEISNFLKAQLAILERKYENLTSDGSNSLVTLFNAEYLEIRQFCMRAYEVRSDLCRNFLETSLKAVATVYQLQLTKVEWCYESVQMYSEEELTSQLLDHLDSLYRQAWWVVSFQEKCKELQRKLEMVRSRYPPIQRKMGNVLNKYKERYSNLEKWFYANYSIQAAATLASGGLGLAARGATIAVNAVRLGYAAVAAGMVGVARMGYGITSTIVSLDTAYPLFDLPTKSFIYSRGCKLVKKLSKRLKELDPSAPTKVLLVIGTKDMNINLTLNQFAKVLIPFTSSSFEYFNASKRSQVLPFPLKQTTEGITRGCTFCQGILVYLRMTNKTASRKFPVLTQLAATLLQQTSLATIILNSKNPNLFLSTLIERSQLGRIPNTLTPTVTVLATNVNETGNIMRTVRSKLPMAKVRNLPDDEANQLQWLSDLKHDLEESTATTYERFYANLNEAVAKASQA